MCGEAKKEEKPIGRARYGELFLLANKIMKLLENNKIKGNERCIIKRMVEEQL